MKIEGTWMDGAEGGCRSTERDGWGSEWSWIEEGWSGSKIELEKKEDERGWYGEGWARKNDSISSIWTGDDAITVL